MREDVTIWYRGASYQLGRGQHGYAIWPAGSPPEQPLEQWPETPAGWSAAWSRFNAVEAPGSIVHLGPPPDPATAQPADAVSAQPGSLVSAQPGSPVSAQPGNPASPQPGNPAPTPPAGAVSAPAGAPVSGPPAASSSWRPAAGPYPPAAGLAWPGARPPGTGPAAGPGGPGSRSAWPGLRSAGPLSAAIMLVTGVVCGVAGLFPAYVAGASLAAQPAELVPHVIYLAVWAASAVLIVSGGIRQRIGALLALGMSIVAFGLFFADLGTVISGGAHLLGAGLVLGLAGWLACTAGSVLAFRLRAPDAPRKLDGRQPAAVAMLSAAALAAIGTAITFAPAWDSYTLRAASGATQSLTAGNAFANPAPVIIGDVVVMVALVGVVIVAGLWRPVRLGAVLLAGAAIPMVAQAISALIQVSEPVSASNFGISPAQAAQAGLTFSSGVTPLFWIYCVFVVALLIAGAWMFMPQRPGSRAGARPGGIPAPVPGRVTTWGP